MINLRIIPYNVKDNEAALSLEQQCTQGKSLRLRFCRPTFHARSGVYDKYRILCAKVDNKLIGIIAWAEKFVSFHGIIIRAAYLYDLRVHPAYRGQGVAIRLARASFEDVGEEVDCIYTLIAGENEAALGLMQRHLGMKLTIPLTYSVIPAYKRLRRKEDHYFTRAAEIHEMYLKINHSIEFVPEFNEEKLLGYVTSIAMGKAMSGGCSIWTNENILAEQVVTAPLRYQIRRILTIPLRQVLPLPYIPKANDMIPSWFLFDFYAVDKTAVRALLAAVNNIALSHDRRFVYILLQNNDHTLTFIRRSGFRIFTFPYFFLATGRIIPRQAEKVYIDIRDL